MYISGPITPTKKRNQKGITPPNKLTIIYTFQDHKPTQTDTI